MTGAELRAARERSGLTIRQLAAALGPDGPAPNTIARWERGELTIRHPGMVRLALVGLAAEMASTNTASARAARSRPPAASGRRPRAAAI